MRSLPAVKRCSRCSAILEATRENFRLKHVTRDGLSEWCRPCCRDYEAERRALAEDRRLRECAGDVSTVIDEDVVPAGRVCVEAIAPGHSRVRFGKDWRPGPDRLRAAVVSFGRCSLVACDA